MKRHVDDFSFGYYTKSLIVAKTIIIPIVFEAFIFRNDIQKEIEINFFASESRNFLRLGNVCRYVDL